MRNKCEILQYDYDIIVMGKDKEQNLLTLFDYFKKYLPDFEVVELIRFASDNITGVSYRENIMNTKHEIFKYRYQEEMRHYKLNKNDRHVHTITKGEITDDYIKEWCKPMPQVTKPFLNCNHDRTIVLMCGSHIRAYELFNKEVKDEDGKVVNSAIIAQMTRQL